MEFYLLEYNYEYSSDDIKYDYNQFKVDFYRCKVYFNTIQTTSIHMFYHMIMGFSKAKRDAYMYFCTQTCLSAYVTYIQSTLDSNTYVGERESKESMKVHFDSLKAHIAKPLRFFDVSNNTLQNVVIHVFYHFDSKHIQCYLATVEK